MPVDIENLQLQNILFSHHLQLFKWDRNSFFLTLVKPSGMPFFEWGERIYAVEGNAYAATDYVVHGKLSKERIQLVQCTEGKPPTLVSSNTKLPNEDDLKALGVGEALDVSFANGRTYRVRQTGRKYSVRDSLIDGGYRVMTRLEDGEWSLVDSSPDESSVLFMLKAAMRLGRPLTPSALHMPSR